MTLEDEHDHPVSAEVAMSFTRTRKSILKAQVQEAKAGLSNGNEHAKTSEITARGRWQRFS